MKYPILSAKSLLSISILLCLSINSSAALKAYLGYSTFHSPKSGPYVETYLTVMGPSVAYKKNSNGKFQGTVEITLLFKQNDSIKAVKKYNLKSQETDDTVSGRSNFTDQQRFALPNGSYDFEIQIADKNTEADPYKWSGKLSVDYDNNKLAVSDIELLESYTKATSENILTKNGYDLLPYVSDFYPDELKKISFYCELYNADKLLSNQKFVVNYFVQSEETNARMNEFGGFSTQTAAPVNVILTSFSVTNLPSGNYYLVIEAKDKSNNLLVTKRRFFQRKNKGTHLSLNDLTAVNVSNTFVSSMISKDSLIDHLKSLRPIASDAEKTFIDENANRASNQELMQQFFLNFWKNRNEANPEGEWKKYYADVKKVNKEFKSINLKGYETDRGRVYLQYGPPDSRIINNSDVGSYPYEMWQYFKIKSQTNRIFIFYNPDYVSSNYKLLHSDVRGEPNNPQWSSVIQKGDNQSLDPSNPMNTDVNYGRNTNQNYLNSK